MVVCGQKWFYVAKGDFMWLKVVVCGFYVAKSGFIMRFKVVLCG